MTEKEIHNLLDKLRKLPKECEWVEFKLNIKEEKENKSEIEIGEYISALSNGANLKNKNYGYLIYGIEDLTHLPLGTKFRPSQHKIGKEEFEHWILQRLSPRIEIEFLETIYRDLFISIIKIQAAQNRPTCFANQDFVRVGSIKRSLKDFPEKEKKIWVKSNNLKFEKRIALENVSSDEILQLLDAKKYYELSSLPYPTKKEAVIKKFVQEKFIKEVDNNFNILNLGAILFAKNLSEFDNLKRKAIRVIQYKGKNKLTTLKDQEGKLGYIVGFTRLVKYINDILPSNEVINQALRETVTMYPELAIRELVANAIIHQDFLETGTGPLIEIYSDRIEITNPGIPMITPDRFIDEYQSRNEDLASIMRRFKICEEKGSGMDKVVIQLEIFQLPAYNIFVQEKHTKLIMYSHKEFSEMDRKDKVRACYQHCALKHVTNDRMSNQSLRKRFEISKENAAIASRVIKETLKDGLIKEEDPNSNSRKFVKYIPFWA